MAKQKIRIQRPKSRRQWPINPATRIEVDPSRYWRPAEKQKERELVAGGIDAPAALPHGRTLCVDYGLKRTGLAVSDPLGITAQGLDTIETADLEELLTHLENLVSEYAVKEIVVGLPLNLDGSHGPQTLATERFIDLARDRLRLPVLAWDERMTTMAAHRAMHEMGHTARGQKGNVDRIAAVLILQSYLDRARPERQDVRSDD